MKVAVAAFMLLALIQGAAAAAPPTPIPPRRTCETDSTQQLVTCLRHCSGRENDASTRVCKEQCMAKHENRKTQCAKSTKQRLIIF